MNRSRPILVAVAIQGISAVFGLFSSVRILAAGSAGLPVPDGGGSGGGPPFWAGLMFFALAIASLFGAYGLWRGQRWGKVVTLITCGVNAVFMAGDVLHGIQLRSPALALAMGMGVLAYILAIVLVLRPVPAPAAG